jgi:hypothetical protein
MTYPALIMTPTPRLACEQCKRRKIRCNKGSPCSACKIAELQCHTVQRARLPRGKSGKSRAHNIQLEDRVARIESLLERQAGAVAEPHSNAGTDQDFETTTSTLSSNHSKVPSSGRPSTATVTNFVAPEFWTALSEEVRGLRETLEDSDDEDPSDGLMTEHAVPDASSTFAILFQQVEVDKQEKDPRLPPHVHTKLLETFHSRVDSVYKILHWPSVLSRVQSSSGSHYSGVPVAGARLLETSIYFMAICTITDEEARTIGLGARLEILQTYRSTVEALLAKSHLLTDPDLIELQAFVLYLVC